MSHKTTPKVKKKTEKQWYADIVYGNLAHILYWVLQLNWSVYSKCNGATVTTATQLMQTTLNSQIFIILYFSLHRTKIDVIYL